MTTRIERAKVERDKEEILKLYERFSRLLRLKSSTKSYKS